MSWVLAWGSDSNNIRLLRSWSPYPKREYAVSIPRIFYLTTTNVDIGQLVTTDPGYPDRYSIDAKNCVQIDFLTTSTFTAIIGKDGKITVVR